MSPYKMDIGNAYREMSPYKMDIYICREMSLDKMDKGRCLPTKEYREMSPYKIDSLTRIRWLCKIKGENRQQQTKKAKG